MLLMFVNGSRNMHLIQSFVKSKDRRYHDLIKEILNQYRKKNVKQNSFLKSDKNNNQCEQTQKIIKYEQHKLHQKQRLNSYALEV